LAFFHRDILQNEKRDDGSKDGRQNTDEKENDHLKAQTGLYAFDE
jgi:hypothetical protein